MSNLSNSFIGKEFLLNDEGETKKLAQNFASKINKKDVIIFNGDLGAGKSFFCREIIKSLCGEKVNVVSPTFNILQTYEAQGYEIYHYDLYRLDDMSEIYELGIEDAFMDNITLIEWPNIITPILPKNTISVNIQILDETKRLFSWSR